MRDHGTAMVQAQEALIAQVNVALEAGDWEQVSGLTADLYALTVQAGDVAFADLVQDLHWIANDALAHPLVAERLLAP